jgi:Mn-dependent DtxR family transcriptional regulator
MTPTEEARFIQLWNAGTETAAIARQLGLKATTAQSRARRLQERGLIQPRPRGGNYPTDRVKARAPGEGGRSTVSPSTVHRPP